VKTRSNKFLELWSGEHHKFTKQHEECLLVEVTSRWIVVIRCWSFPSNFMSIDCLQAWIRDILLWGTVHVWIQEKFIHTKHKISTKKFDLKKERKKPRAGSWSRSSWPVLGRRCWFGVNRRPLAASGGRYPFRSAGIGDTVRVSGHWGPGCLPEAGYRGVFWGRVLRRLLGISGWCPGCKDGSQEGGSIFGHNRLRTWLPGRQPGSRDIFRH
jgi:hypothetical protein